MTPEQVDNAEAEIRKWFPPQVEGEAPIWRRALDMLVGAAKAAIPSGQAAEDEATARLGFRHDDGCAADCPADEAGTALSRLAAKAQSAEAWRKRLEAAADALADVLPGEVGRLDLLARIAELKRQRDEARRGGNRLAADMMRWEAKARDAEERCARLSAAGQVLSAHMDKTPTITQEEWAAMSEDSEPDTSVPRGLPFGWTMRDEFAKAAMQALITKAGDILERPGIARAAYMMADTMLESREAK